MYIKYVTFDSFNVIKLRHTKKLMTCNAAESEYGLQKRCSQPIDIIILRQVIDLYVATSLLSGFTSLCPLCQIFLCFADILI